jgi:hypothetical protein
MRKIHACHKTFLHFFLNNLRFSIDLIFSGKWFQMRDNIIKGFCFVQDLCFGSVQQKGRFHCCVSCNMKIENPILKNLKLYTLYIHIVPNFRFLNNFIHLSTRCLSKSSAGSYFFLFGILSSSFFKF